MMRILAIMDSMSRKEEIKTRAAQLFRERGYSATSMRDIAKEMGMEAPSLYNHISSKQQILSELLMTVAHRFTDGMAEVKSSKLSPRQALEALVKLHVDITIEHPDAIALLTAEFVHLEGQAALEFHALKDAYEEDFREWIKQAVSDGEFPELDVELSLFSILSTLRWLYSWYGRRTSLDKQELERQMTELLLPKA